MRHARLALITVMVLIALAYEPLAQEPTSGIQFGRVGDTTYRGRADRVSQQGAVTTYAGNVRISFPESSIVVQADSVTANSANELVFQGDVRVTLDSK
jgi:hypothetical protein